MITTAIAKTLTTTVVVITLIMASTTMAMITATKATALKMTKTIKDPQSHAPFSQGLLAQMQIIKVGSVTMAQGVEGLQILMIASTKMVNLVTRSAHRTVSTRMDKPVVVKAIVVTVVKMITTTTAMTAVRVETAAAMTMVMTAAMTMLKIRANA